MSTHDPIRAALERLTIMAANELDTPGLWAHSRASWEDAITAARAALEAAPPAPLEGEVGELVAALRSPARWTQLTDAQADRAATLLQQLSAAAPAVVPVAVSERLPGDALCWWYEPDEDDDGSGYGGNWTLLCIRGGVSCYTHWLPAHALPIPAPLEGEVEA